MTTHPKGNSITKTVSMTPELGRDADNRARQLGFRSFSAYVAHLLRNDLISGGDLVLKEQDSPKPTPAVEPARAAAGSPNRIEKYPTIKRK